MALPFNINVIDITLITFLIVVGYLYLVLQELRRLKKVEQSFEKMITREEKRITKEEKILHKELELLKKEMDLLGKNLKALHDAVK